MVKYLSLFSGIGGFEIGIQRAFDKQFTKIEQDGQRGDRNTDQVESDVLPTSRTTPLCIGYSEIDPYADAIYKYNFGGTNYGDCTKIDPTTLPDFDLLVGGFPCQAFSIAGKRGGFEDTRGTLIFDVLRILKEKQPRHVILENVKGLLSHDSGRTFKTIITSLNELGYAVEWQVLNAKNFGVPQNRERVFIVGHLGGFGGRQVFPIRENDTETRIKSVGHSGSGGQKGIIYGQDGIVGALSASDYKQPKQIADYRYDEGLRVRKEFISPTLTRSMRESSLSSSVFLVEKPRIRRLTPKECERLMGLPDDWTKYGLIPTVYNGNDKEMI